MKIELDTLFESLDIRRPHGYVKTINGKLYMLITHSELLSVLKDCGVSIVSHNRLLQSIDEKDNDN